MNEPQEPFSVHDQEGFEPVYTENEMVQVRKGSLRALLDIATGSMDWGSGFLDSEQVEVLREIALIIGVDQFTVTPRNFTCTYNFDGVHDWRPSNPSYSNSPALFCTRCGRRK